MSGYIGEVPKKIKRGYLEILDKNKIIRDERTNKFVFGTSRKVIKKAWVGDTNKEPKLVLYSEDYYMDNRSPLLYDFYDGSTVIYNDKIHVIGLLNNNSSGHGFRGHYSWDGTEWIEETELPSGMDGGDVSSVVYNNKIHILGGSNGAILHYSWDGTSWINEGEMPVWLNNVNMAVVYNNKIHVLGATTMDDDGYHHYSWDGTSWINEGEMPPSYNGGSAVVYDNKIHVLYRDQAGYWKYHYSWDGTSWTYESELPKNYVSVVVYDDKIHILGGYYYGAVIHYSWDGTSWTQEVNLPYNFGEGSAVVYKNKIHILGGRNFPRNHYSWDGTSWIEEINLPYAFFKGSAVVYNNKIHILGTDPGSYPYSSDSKNHYSWDGKNWFNEGPISQNEFCFDDGSAVVYDNKIHILGGYHNGNGHKTWDGTEWLNKSSLPYLFYEGSAVVYNNKIHILGGKDNFYNHYSWDGTSWTDEGHLDIDDPERSVLGFRLASAVVYNDAIYIIGGLSDNDVAYPVYRKIYYNNYKNKWVIEDNSSGFVSVRGSAVVYDNKIHVFGNNYSSNFNIHYSYDGIKWTKEFDIPYSFYSGTSVVFKDEIHLLGGQNSKYGTLETNYNHYFK